MDRLDKNPTEDPTGEVGKTLSLKRKKSISLFKKIDLSFNTSALEDSNLPCFCP